MKKPAKINGRLVITPPASSHWDKADHADETEALRTIVWPAVRKLIAENWPGFGLVFTADDVDLCTHCRSEFEVMTAEDVVTEAWEDEHSIAGEPVCCYEAVAEFRAERGIPALPPRGGAA